METEFWIIAAIGLGGIVYAVFDRWCTTRELRETRELMKRVRNWEQEQESSYWNGDKK